MTPVPGLLAIRCSRPKPDTKANDSRELKDIHGKERLLVYRFSVTRFSVRWIAMDRDLNASHPLLTHCHRLQARDRAALWAAMVVPVMLRS